MLSALSCAMLVLVLVFICVCVCVCVCAFARASVLVKHRSCVWCLVFSVQGFGMPSFHQHTRAHTHAHTHWHVFSR